MNKKLIVIGIILIFLVIGFSGCTKQTENDNQEEEETVTVNAPLNRLGLTLKNLSKDFVKSGEVYNTTPYVIDEGILKDTYVLERYNSSFKESEYNTLDQAIVRCESKEKCISAYNGVKTEISADFPEISGFIIGDDSYVGGKTNTYLGINYSSFVVVFRIADVLVLVSGVTPDQLDFRTYGYVIENNMNKYVE